MTEPRAIHEFPFRGGKWILCDNLELVGMMDNAECHIEYPIDLDRCATSAEVLDWIMQVAGKSWCTVEMLSGLVDAFNILLSPQENLCSMGTEHGPIDVRAAVQRNLRSFRAWEAIGHKEPRLSHGERRPDSPGLVNLGELMARYEQALAEQTDPGVEP